MTNQISFPIAPDFLYTGLVPWVLAAVSVAIGLAASFFVLRYVRKAIIRSTIDKRINERGRRTSFGGGEFESMRIFGATKRTRKNYR